VEFLGEIASEAWDVLVSFPPDLREVVALTLVVSGLSTVIGSALGVPAGLALALGRFRGRRVLRLFVDVGMGIPPVLAGLFLLMLLWSSGPFGGLGLVFTPAAMVLAQVLLAVPIAAGVTAAAVEGLPSAALEQLSALRLPPFLRGRVAAGEARSGVVAAVAAAFGRVVSEVGAVLVVGGNILGETRVLTTLIVQESRQARFGTAIAAGVILLVVAFAVNAALGRLGPGRVQA
jgi:tungstate transport system permease protein